MPVYKGEENRASVKCLECSSDVTEMQTLFKCDVCSNNFHPRCVGIHGQHLTRALNNPDWICKQCKPNTPVSTTVGEELKRKTTPPLNPNTTAKKQNIQYYSDTQTTSAYNQDQLNQMFQFMQNSHTEIMAKVNNVISTVGEVKDNQLHLSHQIDTINNKIQSLTKDQLQVRKDINHLYGKNSQHVEKISKLEAEVDALNQQSIQNNVIIAGLPVDANHIHILSNIMSKIEANCTINDIQDTEIIKSKMQLSSGNNANLLLVKFKTIDSKNEFMNKKYKKRSLLCSEIGLNTSSDKQIFVRDHLTPFRLSIFKYAREFKEKHNYQFVWLKNSIIYLRKTETSQVHIIKTQYDLDKLLPNTISEYSG